MRVLSIDQATNSGFCLWDTKDNSIIRYDGYKCKNKDFNKTIYEISSGIGEVIKNWHVDYVVFEDIQFQRNVQTLIKLARLQGAIIHVLENYDLRYDIISPKTWQSYIKNIKDFDSNYDNTKEMSLNFVKNKFDIETKNNNISDAICIGYYAINNIDIEGKG